MNRVRVFATLSTVLALGAFAACTTTNSNSRYDATYRHSCYAKGGGE